MRKTASYAAVSWRPSCVCGELADSIRPDGHPVCKKCRESTERWLASAACNLEENKEHQWSA